MLEKSWENQLRKEAKKQNLALEKNRSQGWYHGTYRLVDPYNNTIAVGGDNYGLSLEDVQKALAE